ncbi:hypothetical protein B9Z19DRAFT_1131396 [Tuber borchii]|uniref:Uncharacterized protein n=1 Tax=Tuber borchii TaxID=42251 RepID=A0A2T6ZIU9_TUBBO|nr:hypothetical protein B9Z19DRAFT_1131396 [Tuber borchii]
MPNSRRTPNYPRDNNNAFNTTGSSNHNANAQNYNNNVFNRNNNHFNANTIFVVMNTSNEIEERSAREIARRISETLSPPFLAAPPNPDSILQEATIHQHQEWLQATTDELSLEGSPGATLERINAQGGRISGVLLTDSIQSPNMGMPAAPPISHTMPSAYLLPGSSLPSAIVPPMDDPEKETIIAVQVKAISLGKSPVFQISKWAMLPTAVHSYFFPYRLTKITLVDTPSFGNLMMSDYEVLAEISAWASSAYTKGRLLPYFLMKFANPVPGCVTSGPVIFKLGMLNNK